MTLRSPTMNILIISGHLEGIKERGKKGKEEAYKASL